MVSPVLKFDADEAADALLTAKPVLLEKLRVACDVDLDGACRGIREVLALTGLSTEGLTAVGSSPVTGPNPAA